MTIMQKTLRIFVGFMLLCFIADYQNKVAQGCHAGHQKKEEDNGDEETLILVDHQNATLEDDEVNALLRSKRQLSEETDSEFPILRAYFRDCMFDKIDEPWEWKSIIDFTILKTWWFLYSGDVACSEKRGKDDTTCWKDCIDAYLRNTSSMINVAKACVDEYQADFLIGKKTYTIRRPLKRKVRPKPPKDNYERCVQMQYDDANPDLLLQEVGIFSVPNDANLNVETIVRFIRGHVKCSICEYSPLPSGQRKPDFTENTDIGRRKQLSDGSVTYVVTWPFEFEALVRRDSKLRKAISFCNGELETTFRKTPPKTLEWTQWFTWGTCNALCGKPGVQRRLRVCLDENEKKCSGDKYEQRICHNRNCAYWTSWGPYTPCMSTCDLSEQYSFRYCKKGQPGEEGCQGSRIRRRSCAIGSCQVPWSQWTTCSVTCGSGIQQRTGGDSLLRLRTETKPCFSGSCPERWTPWTQWGPCTKTCGEGGQYIRQRHCLSRHCAEPTKQIVPCSAPPCKAQWSQWEPWSSCVYKKRSRTCKGGNTCSGDNVDYSRCSTSDCESSLNPYHATWTEWTQWSPCNARCGSEGDRRRTRDCRGRHSHMSSCDGNKSEGQHCYGQPCTYSVERSSANCVDQFGSYCKGHLVCSRSMIKKCRKSCGYC